MEDGLKKQIWFIVVLTILAVCVVLPSFGKYKLPEWWLTKSVKLGLDLQGGAYLVMGVVTEEVVKSSLTSTALSIKSDLKAKDIPVVKARQKGDRQIELTLLNNRAIPELEAIVAKDYNYLKEVGREDNGRLVVSYEMSDQQVKTVSNNAVEQAIETIRNRVDQYGVAEPVIQRIGERMINVQLPAITNIDDVKSTIGKIAKLEFRIVGEAGDQDLESLPTREGGSYGLQREVLMTGDAVQTASVEISPSDNQVQVSLKLTSVGAKTFDRITSDNVGKQLAIVLDNVIQSAPTINERISGGSAQISGRFTQKDASQLAIVLRSGALPAPLTIETERTVGASLGADSIKKGVNASLLGVFLVLAFMILYYKKSGLLAVCCLALNLLFLLAIFILFGATLTLPGLAGIALTAGMAVDANVIIFERIKEELRAGVDVGASIRAGFHKANWAILDSNITTLLAGFILYAFGSGPIKGFAVMLNLGILTSMFSALFMCKLGFRVLNLRKLSGSLSI